MDKDIHLFVHLIIDHDLMTWSLWVCSTPWPLILSWLPHNMSHRPDVGGLFTFPSTTLPAYIRKVPSHYIWQIHNLRFKYM